MSGYKQWDDLYSKRTPLDFGSETTYRKGYEWLKDCSLIEDWGCGYGGFGKLCRPGQYRGIDGSCTPAATEYVDLCAYHSSVPGIFMRHVLEHNDEWAAILRNAVTSFTQRMVLVIFTPLSPKTWDIYPLGTSKWRHYSFAKEDLIQQFGAAQWRLEENIPTPTQFGLEHMFYLWK